MHAHIPSRISSILYPLSFILVLACSPSTTPNSHTEAPRHRVTVSGSITEDTVWEQGKDYVVVGDVVVEGHSLLTIEPDVRIFVKADTEEDYYGLIVKGRLLADGGDALHMIRFAPAFLSVGGDVSLWRVPGLRDLRALLCRPIRTVGLGSEPVLNPSFCST